MVQDDILTIIEEDETQAETQAPWNVLVVDDDAEVHGVTRISLSNFRFHGRPLAIHSCYSAAEAFAFMEGRKDIACVLLDVVMEDEHAGLTLVRRIREELRNHQVRIVLRTGQPGYAPEMEVITGYDINDYKAKTELTATRLASTLITALRSYEQITMLDDYHRGLEMVITASADLFAERNIKDFAAGVVTQLAAQIGVPPEGVLCTTLENDELVVIAGAGRFGNLVLRPLGELHDPEMERVIRRALADRANVFQNGHTAFYLESTTARPAVAYVKGEGPKVDDQRHLLQLFAMNISLGFETAQLFERLKATAYVDPLTGLPNRAGFIAAINAVSDRAFRVLIVDIDHFHDITGHLGFSVGDILLKAVAERLAERFPDAIALAHLSSDQFALALPADEAETAAKLLQAFDTPFSFAGIDTHVGVTGGMTRALAHQIRDGDVYMHEASRAMKEAKRMARGQILSYDAALDEQVDERMALLGALRRAIKTDEICLHFQPKVDLQNGRPMGVEALVRWQSKQFGMVSPGSFIPIAEVSGLILPLGAKVFELGLRQRRAWLEQGHDIKVAINVSAVQIQQDDFLRVIDGIAGDIGVDPAGIEIEITETSLLAEDEQVFTHLQGLRARGYGLALDDFGTGYSSLSHLHLLPLTTLKIDRRFVSSIDAPGRSAMLVAAIVSVARSMGTGIVAEGIETEEQRKRLIELGVEMAQGYLFARPMPAAQLADWWAAR